MFMEPVTAPAYSRPTSRQIDQEAGSMQSMLKYPNVKKATAAYLLGVSAVPKIHSDDSSNPVVPTTTRPSFRPYLRTSASLSAPPTRFPHAPPRNGSTE